jgi:hypothetical protein
LPALRVGIDSRDSMQVEDEKRDHGGSVGILPEENRFYGLQENLQVED